MKRDYSILTEQDFLEHTHQELAELQLGSLDKKISTLKKYFVIFNILIIAPIILSLILKSLIIPLALLLIITFICIKLKKRIEFKSSIRNFMYRFFKSNNLIND